MVFLEYQKKFILVFIGIISFAITTPIVSAMTPTFPNDAKYNRAITNTCYYVDSTASTYTSYINSGARSWAIMNNPIKMTAVSSTLWTNIDFYGTTQASDPVLAPGVLGYASFWSNTGTLVASPGYVPSVNYYYTRVILNKSEASSKSTAVLAHEIGHTFGLAHTSNLYSIMYPYADKVLVSTPQPVDNDTINYLY